jgi:hypothetical protein
MTSYGVFNFILGRRNSAFSNMHLDVPIISSPHSLGITAK